ncbi:MAG: hypothetical protein WAZ14_04625 [Patescibacteria group bacterium]
MSQHLTIKSADLVIPSPKGELDIRSVLHALPQGKGWVFGLFSLESKDETAKERIAHILRSHLEHLAADLADEPNVVRRFEQGLSRVNRDLNRAAKDLSLNIDKFDAVIGVLAGHQIFLSGIGKLKAIFLHKTAERRYVIYELDEQFHVDQAHTWEKPLVAVLDGEFHPGDIFYLASPIPRLALSLDELQDILVTLPPAGALQRIRQFLPATDHFGGIAFQAMQEDKTGIVRKANPISSLQELENTKEQTANVLGDQQADLVHTVKEMASGISKKLASPGMRGAQTTAKRGLALTVKGLSKVIAVLAALVMKLQGYLKTRFREARTSRALRHGVGRTRNTSKPGFMGASRAFMRELSAPRKFAVISFMLAMVVIGGVVFINGGESEGDKTALAFATSVKAIDDKILAAEASLIYRNTEEAQRTLSEAAAGLETLPRDTNEHSAEANRLAKALAALQAKIRGVTLVEPSVIADLRSIDASASLLTGTLTPNGIIALADNLNAYKLDSLSGAWIKQETVNGPVSRITSSTTLQNDVLVVDATQQLARLDLTALTLTTVNSGTNGMASVEDITTYNDTLYALTADSQQVVKMRAQYPSFEAGTVWINANTTDLTSARAIAIDSDVYMLLANDIIKFTSGREQDWQTATIDPPLSAATDLYTSLESPYLYVLDPAETRVLVLLKATGAIQAQYVNEAFGQAVGFIVEEATSKITVITGTEALEFTPSHLLK